MNIEKLKSSFGLKKEVFALANVEEDKYVECYGWETI